MIMPLAVMNFAGGTVGRIVERNGFLIEMEGYLPDLSKYAFRTDDGWLERMMKEEEASDADS